MHKRTNSLYILINKYRNFIICNITNVEIYRVNLYIMVILVASIFQVNQDSIPSFFILYLVSIFEVNNLHCVGSSMWTGKEGN